jgi:hypothetical protein
MVRIMPSAVKGPLSVAGLIDTGKTWPEFMARVLTLLAPCDNQPDVQSRGGLQVLERVIIRREIKLGQIHIAQGEAGTVTCVRGKGRLLDVRFAAGSVTLHHLDVLPAKTAPGGGLNTPAMTAPRRNPLLARPDNTMHPNDFMRGKPQFRVGRV